MRFLVLVLLVAAGCDDSGSPPGINPAMTDLAVSTGEDGGGGVVVPTDPNGNPPPVIHGGPFVLPTGPDDPVEHAPPSSLNTTTLFAGLDVLDVSVDQGGGVWAVTASTVYYLPP